MRLNGKTVLITGASDGIGKALSVLLIRQYGCRVFGLARNRQKLQALRNSLGAKAECFFPIAMDVTDSAAWQELQSRLLPVDLLINNAGVMPPFRRAEHFTAEETEQTLRTDLCGVLYAVNAFLPSVRKRKGGIINIASADAFCPIVGTAVYAAAKAAVAAYTRVVADENPELLISCVFPGFCRTHLFAENAFGAQKALVDRVASSPEATARAILRAAERGKSRILTGFDAKLMCAGNHLLGPGTSKLIRDLMRLLKIEVFANVFDGGITVKKEDYSCES